MKGHVRKRGTQSWAVVFDLGRDENGKRKQKWFSVKGTKRDAEREMARLVHELNTGSYIEPSRMSVGEYLDRWLADHAKQTVSGKTFERYAEIVSKNLKPGLGHIHLEKLRPLDIQRFHAEALRSGRRDGKGGLSAQTVLHFHRVLRSALHQAMKWQMILRNPADAVDPPKPPRREMAALDESGTAWLITAAKGTKLHAPIVTAVTTGLRRGEILALRWMDVEFERCSITVRRSLEQTKAGLRFKSPKTKKGRQISAPSYLLDILREHRERQEQTQRSLGQSVSEEDLVFGDPTGAPWAPDSLTSEFKDFRNRIGSRIRFHDLRHSHASQLLKHGIHPKVVSERLGHSSVAITLDLYSHVLPGLQEEAASKIDVGLRAALAQFEAHEKVN